MPETQAFQFGRRLGELGCGGSGNEHCTGLSGAGALHEELLPKASVAHTLDRQPFCFSGESFKYDNDTLV